MINRVARGLNSEKSLLILTLGLTAAVGVTTTLMGALVYGLVFLVVLGLSLTLAAGLRGRWPTRWIFGLTCLVVAGLVTLADWLLTLHWPALRNLLGIYLPLTAASPVLLGWGFDLSQDRPVSTTLGQALRTGLAYLSLLLLVGGLRELLGTGGWNLVIGKAGFVIPGFQALAPQVLVSAAGGFILIGLLKALLNFWELRRGQPLTFDQLQPVKEADLDAPPATVQPFPRPTPLPAETPTPASPHPTTASEPMVDTVVAEIPANVTETLPPNEPAAEIETVALPPVEAIAPDRAPEETADSPSNPPLVEADSLVTEIEPPTPSEPAEATETPASTESVAPSARPETNWEAEPTEPVWQNKPAEWGDTMATVLTELGHNRDFERKRLLIIGCGTGEDAYYYGMQLMEAQKANPRLTFRIRGVDNFPARIETALAGIYREAQVDFIPLDLKKVYLLKSKEEEKRLVRMTNELRVNLEFEVNDYLSEELYFPKPADLIAVNQTIDYLSDDKKRQLLRQIKNHLGRDGILFLRYPVARELLPEGLKRSGERIFRKK